MRGRTEHQPGQGSLALTTCLIVIITITYSHSTQSRLSARVWLPDESNRAETADPYISENVTYDLDAFNLNTCGLTNLNQWQSEQRAFRCPTQQPFIGRYGAQPRIVDGTRANEGGFPFHVELTCISKNDSYYYGGTLIHNDLILTHSYNFLRQESKLIARFGSNREQNRTEIAASKWCYYKDTGVSLGLDLAIIRLKEPVRYERNKIWPVCLMKGWEKPRQPTICSAIGMGLINDKNEKSDYLMTLPVRRRCFDFPADKPRFKYSHCYLADDIGFSCTGDRGSPVVCYDRCGGNQTQAFAVGMISGARKGSYCRPGQGLKSILVSEYHDAVLDLTSQVRKTIGGTEPAHMICRLPGQ